MVTGLLGILKVGAAYVPLDPDYPAERLAYMLEDSQVSLLLTQESLKKQLAQTIGSGQMKILCLDSEWDAVAESSDVDLPATASAENLAYVIYTSGSTGKPKGVMNSDRGVVNRLAWSQEEYGLQPTERVLQKTSFSFDVSGVGIFLASEYRRDPGFGTTWRTARRRLHSGCHRGAENHHDTLCPLHAGGFSGACELGNVAAR